ncbi:hypothetical protein ACFQU2_03380 [Siccirubricoccus deserti]
MRRIPALARPGIPDAVQAALDRAVLLAVAPASARQAVPDRVLAGFIGGRAEAAALADPWAALPTALPAPLASDPRLRAVEAATGVPAVVAVRAVGSAAPPTAPPRSSPLVQAEAVRASLDAAEVALREAGWQHAATALDQARAAAGGLVQALTAKAPNPLRRLPAAASPALAAAADAALAQLQVRAGNAPDGLPAALAEARASLAALDSPPPAVLGPLAALAPDSIRALPTAPAAPSLVLPRLIPPPLVLSARPMPSLPAAWPALPPASLPTGWGGRPASVEPAAEAAPPDPPDGPGQPSYGAVTAGALAGMAAAARLMCRNGLGSPLDWDALARLIAGFDACAGTMPPLDAGDYGRLMQWSSLARQLALLRGQFGLTPWDPAQQPALAKALRDRACWLAERPPWPERDGRRQPAALAAAGGMRRSLRHAEPWRGRAAGAWRPVAPGRSHAAARGSGPGPGSADDGGARCHGRVA